METMRGKFRQQQVVRDKRPRNNQKVQISTANNLDIFVEMKFDRINLPIKETKADL